MLKIVVKYRKERKHTQKQMAKQLGLECVRTYQRMESGETSMSVERFIDICRVLKLRVVVIPEELIIL